MKISYSPLKQVYKVEDIKSFEEKDIKKESRVQWIIEPQTASFFTNFQKRKLKQILNESQSVSPVLSAFLKDLSVIQENVELEFDSRGLPWQVVNHQEIWKKWLYHTDILNSKYSGEWFEKEMPLINNRIADQESFLKLMLDDFIMSELYGRDIYRIDFDKRTMGYRQNREESALGIPLEFSQEYNLKITSQRDQLEITGYADLSKNRKRIKQLCSGKSFRPEDITSIEQRTVYAAQNMEYIPDSIESVFSINGKNECFKKNRISITVTEL